MDSIPISALEHYIYCPRQCGLILADGVWSDNVHTVRGARGHRRADTDMERAQRGRRVLHAVPLWSESRGLSGRADAVEVLHSGEIIPVEYKIGRRHGDTAEIQLCAQALCLEEMLSREISRGALWHSGPMRRTEVRIDASLRSRTEEAILAVRAIAESGQLPCARNDSRCRECQLRDYCLPDVVGDAARVTGYVKDQVFACDA